MFFKGKKKEKNGGGQLPFRNARTITNGLFFSRATSKGFLFLWKKESITLRIYHYNLFRVVTRTECVANTYSAGHRFHGLGKLDLRAAIFLIDGGVDVLLDKHQINDISPFASIGNNNNNCQ